MALFSWHRQDKKTPNRSFPALSPPVLLNLCLVLLALLHVGITISHYLSNQFYTQDVSHIDYLFYSTYHGRFFWSIVCEAPHFSKHFTPTLVLLVPFHAVFQHVLFIPIVEDLAVISGAWAVAWMTKGFFRQRGMGETSSSWGLALGVFYVANVYTGSILLAHHFESFALGLSLWALAALANRRYRLFWLLLVLSLGVKEDMALYWGVFGLWWIVFGWEKNLSSAPSPASESLALEKESSRKHGFRRFALFGPPWRRRLLLGGTVFLLCAVWALLAVYTTRTVAQASGQPLSEFAGRYDWMGKTLLQRVLTIVSTPRYVLTPLQNMAHLLLPGMLYLPVLSPASLLLLLPGTYVMQFSKADPQFYLLYYYAYPFLPFLFLGASRGLVRVLFWCQRRPWHLRRMLSGGIFAIILVAAGSSLFLPTRTDLKKRWPAVPTERHAWIRQTLPKMIPPQVSVTAQFDILPLIPYRKAIYPLSEGNMERAEYWVFDVQGFLGDLSSTRVNRMISKSSRLVEEKKAELVLDAYGLLIFRRI